MMPPQDFYRTPISGDWRRSGCSKQIANSVLVGSNPGFDRQRMAGISALETLTAASPTAAASGMRRDGSASVAPALSAGAGSAAGVVPEAAVPVAA